MNDDGAGSALHLGPFGQDSDLRRCGIKTSRAGRENAKSEPCCGGEKASGTAASVVVSGEVYRTLRNSHKVMRAVA